MNQPSLNPGKAILLYGECQTLPDKDYHELNFRIHACTKNDKDVYISYFLYKKVQADKTPFKFYHDINDTIASIYLEENNDYHFMNEIK